MLAAFLLVAQVAAADHPNAQSPRVGDPDTVATCRAAGDPQQRTWSLARRNGEWLVIYMSRALDQPQVELRLPGETPSIAAGETRVSFKSANGGRSVEWRIAGEQSTLDLYVNHGLEVNVEADLDPAVDHMNTDGALTVRCGPPSLAQPASFVARASADREWVMAAGVARSVNLFQSTAGRSYAVLNVGWGRELTRDWGPGALRGRFVWAVEAMPVFAQFSPSAIYGIGFAPIVWRWNFTPRARYSMFGELSMGGMWSTEPIPEETSRGNFTAHWGGGIRLHRRGADAVVIAYRFQHFSNGNQLGSNPGVNSHVILIGWSHRS
jgi:hypothetical protein